MGVSAASTTMYDVGMVTTTRFQQVFDKAMALSPDERVELAHLLLGTIDEPDADWWATIEPEVERRLAAIRSGESKTIPWAEVRRRMAERLDGKRDSLL
jgi:putative addiction module component (TIGR02574 family)